MGLDGCASCGKGAPRSGRRARGWQGAPAAHRHVVRPSAAALPQAGAVPGALSSPGPHAGATSLEATGRDLRLRPPRARPGERRRLHGLRVLLTLRGVTVIPIAAKGSAPWVAVLSETKSSVSRQHRVWALACGHSAAVTRNGRYVTPPHCRCRVCPPAPGPPGGKRSHHVRRAQPSRRLLEEALERDCAAVWG